MTMNRIFVVLILIVSSCRIADLSTNALSLQPKGESLLATSQKQSGGLESWQELEQLEYSGKDQWFGIFKLMNPWKANPQEFNFKALANQDHARIRLINGKNYGNEYGIQNWVTYQKVGKNPIEFTQSKKYKFLLPTYNYFFQLPFRISEANQILSAGSIEIENKKYDIVFATWGDKLVNKEFDQYLIYINSKTNFIEIVEFTVREKGKSFRGGIMYSDFKRNENFMLPYKIEVFTGKLNRKKILHTITLEEINLKAEYKRELLVPNTMLRDTK